jgi:hypothetical protein
MIRDKRTLTTSSNNKGLLCLFKPILCQEGYCHHCQIYLTWQSKNSSRVGRKALARERNG